ncbi:uncharacterized protein LOC143491305 isoform X2 [Brachyhypopomus gauderio]|uniref:uncharacterized protein LOC143491305 isoform X2 n=1 Tax=Brachyhypopomus gauderio TaxID=698409 RepID=UPI004041A3E9
MYSNKGGKRVSNGALKHLLGCEDRAQGLEEPEDVLLEVLNHCRLLQAAVQRLEQKLDVLQSCPCAAGVCRKEENLEEAVVPPPVGAAQLSRALAQRLGPSPQTTPFQNVPPHPPPQPSSQSLAQSRPPGGGRGKGKRRRPPKQRSQPDQVQLQQEGPRDEGLTAKPGPEGRGPGGQSGRLKKGKKRPTAGGVAKMEANSLGPVTVKDAPLAKDPNMENTNVMIGRWQVLIPGSMYMRACEEAEPQHALVTVLSALYPTGALSRSVTPGNRQRAVRQIDCNELEALREWLEEVFPQYDCSVSGSVWAQCLDVIKGFMDLHNEGSKAKAD